MCYVGHFPLKNLLLLRETDAWASPHVVRQSRGVKNKDGSDGLWRPRGNRFVQTWRKKRNSSQRTLGLNGGGRGRIDENNPGRGVSTKARSTIQIVTHLSSEWRQRSWRMEEGVGQGKAACWGTLPFPLHFWYSTPVSVVRKLFSDFCRTTIFAKYSEKCYMAKDIQKTHFAKSLLEIHNTRYHIKSLYHPTVMKPV